MIPTITHNSSLLRDNILQNKGVYICGENKQITRARAHTHTHTQYTCRAAG